MRGKTRVQLRGFAELAMLLKNLPDKMQKKIIRKALRDAARILEQEAKLRAPRGATPTAGSSALYGHLADQIFVRAPKLIGHKGISVIAIGTGDAFWGLFLEKGTRSGLDAEKHKFFEPAFESVWKEQLDLMRDRIMDFLMKQSTGV